MGRLEASLVVSVAQLVERRTVAPVVEGSSPSAHPTFLSFLLAGAGFGAG